MYSSKLAEITEGWGLYCEEMMYNSGYAHDLKHPDLEQKFLQINARRWRATRMVVDVGLHLGRMSMEEAATFLQEMTGYNETTARSEVLMYSLSPGYFLSYLLGYHLITELKKALPIPEKEFHNKLLYAGNVPWWFLKYSTFSSSRKQESDKI
jgi:uncharacterized protein (DUF885 family)